MKTLKRNLVAFALVLPMITSCGSKSEVHKHAYIFHEAVNPTCVAAGSVAYYTCEGCDLYFDTDYQEISADSISVSATGHSYDSVRVAHAPTKTNYQALESFDPTGLVIEKYCERCNDAITITEGITFDKDVLHADDTSVTAMVLIDGQTKLLDIAVSVNKLATTISGNAPTYEVKCHETPNFGTVTSSYGTVTTTVLNAAGTAVSDLATLVAGTYTVKFAYAGDKDHAAAEVASTLTVTHDFSNEVKSEAAKVSDATCITYATYKKSCACGELSDETFEDTTSGYGDHVLRWTEGETEDVYGCTVDGCDHIESTYNKELVVSGTQTLDMSLDTASVNIATKSGYDSVVSLKLDGHDLGVDPNNLDVIDFKNDATLHGVDKELKVVVLKNGQRHSYSVKVDVVTKVLKTKTDLNVIHETSNEQAIYGCYVLGNDINMNNTQSDNSGSSPTQAYGFRGTFDGRGYTITNYSPTWKPLFGMIGYKALVRNLNLTNVSFQQGDAHGVLSRSASSATIENINISFKSVSVFGGHEGLKSQKSGMINGSGSGVANTFKNITVNAQGFHLYGVLGNRMGADTYENYVVNCKDYDVLGFANDGANPVTSVDGVTVNLDPVIEELDAPTKAYTISSSTGSYTLPSEYASMNVTSVTLRNTSISLGSDLANLDFSAIKDNANYLGYNGIVITGTLNGEPTVVAAKIAFADKVVTTAEELTAAVTDNTNDGKCLSGYVALGNDISGSFGCDLDVSWNDGFHGTFNGCGYTVTMNSTARGLFTLTDKATIMNTKFVALNMTQSWKTHILSHKMSNTVIENCQFEYSIANTETCDGNAGIVTGPFGGGPNTIKNSTFTNTGTTAAKLVFGFASNAYPLTTYMKLSGCSSTGPVEHFGCSGTSNSLSAITDYWDFSATATGQLVKYVA